MDVGWWRGGMDKGDIGRQILVMEPVALHIITVFGLDKLDWGCLIETRFWRRMRYRWIKIRFILL